MELQFTEFKSGGGKGRMSSFPADQWGQRFFLECLTAECGVGSIKMGVRKQKGLQEFLLFCRNSHDSGSDVTPPPPPPALTVKVEEGDRRPQSPKPATATPHQKAKEVQPSRKERRLS
jgi:hypothetical protein